MARFRVGDMVVGNRLANRQYTVTCEGYTARVLRTLENGVIEIENHDGDFPFMVDEKCFDLVKKIKTKTIKQIQEINYDELPRKGDLVKILSFDEVLAKRQNEYIDTRKKPGVVYNIRAYTNEHYYPVIEMTSEGNIEFLQSSLILRRDALNELIGAQAIVEVMSGEGEMLLRTLKGDRRLSSRFAEEMVEVIERDYVKKQMEEEKRKYEESLKSCLEDEVVKEMISKIDIKSIKRVLSACLKLDAKNIIGVETLVKEWAVAKKELYLLLGNNLKITVEKQIDMNRDEKERVLREIKRKFPRRMLLFI